MFLLFQSLNLCVWKSFSTEVFGLSIYVLTPSPNYAAAPPRFQEVWNSWLLGVDVYILQGMVIAGFGRVTKVRISLLKRISRVGWPPLKTETKWRGSENSKKSPSILNSVISPRPPLNPLVSGTLLLKGLFVNEATMKLWKSLFLFKQSLICGFHVIVWPGILGGWNGMSAQDSKQRMADIKRAEAEACFWACFANRCSFCCNSLAKMWWATVLLDEWII